MSRPSRTFGSGYLSPDATPFKDNPSRSRSKIEGKTQEIIELKQAYIGGRIGRDEFKSRMTVLKSKL